jgi:hypothetical protein
MRASVVPLLAISGMLVLAAVAPSSAARPGAPSSAESAARAREVRRIQAHFDSVLTELADRDLSALTGAQRARRGALVETLRVYRDRGEFPHNYDFPGEAVPYFVDRGTGVLCAVGHLLATSGRRDIVDRVAAMNNNVWVGELATDSALASWLDTHGLTLAEAARIQVPYMGDPEPVPQVARDRDFPTGASLALGGALVASYWNARPNATGASRVANALGIMAGATAFAAGASSVGDGGASPTVGVASMVVGAASTWLSTRNIVRYRRIAEQKREAARASVAPVLPLDGSAGAGIGVTLRF